MRAGKQRRSHLSRRGRPVYPEGMSQRPELRLRPREEDRLLRGHPWIYDNEIADVSGSPGPGDEVGVKTSRGRFLGSAIWSPASKIRARRYSWKDEPFDAAFIEARLADALVRRSRWKDPAADSMRAVFAEADGLPGLVVDRFVGEDGEGRRGSWLSAQFLSRGIEARREAVLSALAKALAPDGIMERSDSPVRALEGLEPRSGVVAGSVPERLTILENGLRFGVSLGTGQKTGWFLDQQENRAATAAWARGRRVLDVFCNAGGFALCAAAAGAESVLAVDASADAVRAVGENAGLNGLGDRVKAVEANAFDFLRDADACGADGSYGLVVLDPPAFAKNKASLDGAVRGYKEINLRAMKLLAGGGVLATYSCSFWLSRDRFLAALEDAATDAGVTLRYLEERGQAHDHPVVSGYAESRYLKGFIVAVERRR